MDGVRAATPQQLQIPPLRCAPVGMTRVGWLLSGRMATWMDGVGERLLREDCQKRPGTFFRPQ